LYSHPAACDSSARRRYLTLQRSRLSPLLRG
jgi:hypothetical protein